ncbi:MAG: carboxylesterase/lipase family protein [bacterium]
MRTDLERQFILKITVILVLLMTFLALGGCGRESKPLETNPRTERSLKHGPVIGATGENGGHQWLGIPYAKPPVNDRRWAPPVAPAGWSDTLTATKHGNPCPQLASRLGGVQTADQGTPVGSEDCLYLDVYAPSFQPEQVPDGNEQLPVMVWIHGGGNVIGHTKLYDGSRLASKQNVIVVAVQYRLGPLGWFRHPSLRGPGTSPAERSGNFALLDLIQSLKWVRENIASFGGDPNTVTVFGESAGGRNVYNLMLSPLAEGLFDRAIVQSGVLATTKPSLGEKYEQNGGHNNSSREVLIRLLQEDGRAESAPEARKILESMGSDSTESYLKKQPPKDLMRAIEASELGMPMDPPRVFADGVVLPETDPLKVFKNPGSFNNVPLITGTNRDETKIFLSQDPAWVDRFLGLIPQLKEPDLYDMVAEYSSNQWKGNAVDRPATVLSQSGSTVYGYRFDWDEFPSLMGADLSKILGASHGFEIPFVFGDFSFGGGASDFLFTEANRTGRLQLSKQMRSYWAEFARSGSPTKSGMKLPTWPQWTAKNSRYIVFDSPTDGGIRVGSETYDPEKLLQVVEEDDRLANQRQRCVVYRAMATYVGHFDRERYNSLSQCEVFPWMNYPWRDQPTPDGTPIGSVR